MPATTKTGLSGIAKTLLIPLYIRAMESQRPDALIKDERAEALVRQFDPDDLRQTLALTEDSGRMVMILKSREFDRFAQDFLVRHPQAVVVHIGCGLDTRFERVDNGQVEWYDLDLPEVIDLRRAFTGAQGGRCHLLAGSVLEEAWLEALAEHRQRPCLFIAEGVFMYFTEDQVKSLVLRLKEHFPSAELIFDAYSPFMRWAHNRRDKRHGTGAHLNWALKHSQDLESWSAGIRLLDERFPFQFSEVEQRCAWRVRLFSPLVAKGVGVFRYQL